MASGRAPTACCTRVPIRRRCSPPTPARPPRRGRGVHRLMVATDQRALIERPAGRPGARTAEPGVLGLRGRGARPAPARRLPVLAVERVRDPLSADAAYLLMLRDLEDEYEVKAVSGLPADADRHPAGLGSPRARRTSRPAPPGRGRRPLGVRCAAAGRHRAALPGGRPHARREQGGRRRRRRLRPGRRVLDRPGARSCSSSPTRSRSPRPTGPASRPLERERRGWLSFLADSGDFLAGSLDQDMTMAITGQIVVPRIAQWCAVHLDDDARPPGPRTGLARGRAPGRAAARRPRGRHPGTNWTGGNCDRHWARVHRIPLRGARPADRPPDARRVPRGPRCAASPSWSPSRSPDGRRSRSTTPGRTASSRPSARALQSSLLPSSVPEAPGLDVGVVYEAAGRDDPGRRRLLRPVPDRQRDVVLRRRRRVRHRGRGGRGHRAGQAHDPGAGARGLPHLRDVSSASTPRSSTRARAPGS